VKVYIRSAKRSDIKAIAKLADELMPIKDLSEREKILEESVRDKKHDVSVAETKGEIVGFVDFWTFPDFVHGGNLTIIQNLVVSPAYKGFGFADLLIEKVIQEAKKRKALELHVWTEFDNKPAINLYAKHEFKRRSLLLEKEFEE